MNLITELNDIVDPKNEAAWLAAMSNPDSPIFKKESALKMLKELELADLELAQLQMCLIECLEDQEERAEWQEKLTREQHRQQEELAELDEEDEQEAELNEMLEKENMESTQEELTHEELTQEMERIEELEEKFEKDWEEQQEDRADKLVEEMSNEGLFSSEEQKRELQEKLAARPSPLQILKANPVLVSHSDLGKVMNVRGGMVDELNAYFGCMDEPFNPKAYFKSFHDNKKKVRVILEKFPGGTAPEVVLRARDLFIAKRDIEARLEECPPPRARL